MNKPKIVIVVIDDHRIFLTRWTSVLSQDGVDVVVYNHHCEFLNFCEKNPDFPSTIDFIISDRMVPGFDALKDKFLSRFKVAYPSYKGVSFLSTALHGDGLREARKEGFAAVMTKEAVPLDILRKMAESFQPPKNWISRLRSLF